MLWASAATILRRSLEETCRGLRFIPAVLFLSEFSRRSSAVHRKRPGRRSRRDVSGRHRESRHSIRSQHRSVRKKVSAGDNWAGRGIHRLRQRRVAGHFPGEWNGLAGARAETYNAQAVSQQSLRNVHRWYAQCRLFRNNGNGTCSDVTQKAGLAGVKEFSTSAAWVDYDKDGKLDLVVGNYVQWSPETDLYCTMDGKNKSYCTPESYKGTSVRLWHNNGNGTFSDVTQKAGLGEPSAKTLGVAMLDYDNDGWPVLLFSNDTQPNKLYRNNGPDKGGNVTFTEKAVVAGVAFSEDGVARAGMGVDTSD